MILWLWVPACAGTTGPTVRSRPATLLRSRRFANAGFAQEFPPLRNQRAQGMPDAQPHPRPHVQRKRHMSFSHHRSGRFTGTPCAMFYDLFRALSGDRAFCHRRWPRCGKHRRQLHASVEALRPRGFVVRGWCVRLAHHARPSHPATHVRDDREAPLRLERDTANRKAVSGWPRSGIFLQLRLDRANQPEATR